MPVSSFFSSFADKAQNAIQSSPLAGHLPSHRPSSPAAAAASTEQHSSDTASAPARGSHFTTALSHQFRSLQQQYGSASPYQKMITTSKGVALDFDSLSRDTKASSKEMYTWAQTEAEDIKDVCDRLAYFSFAQGSLAGTLSTKLDAARSPLKTLRNAESNRATHRNIRTSYARDIKIEEDQSRRNEKRLAELERLLEKAEIDDEPLEREFELIARRSIKDSEQAKWDAIREYGEKLVILSKAATQVIDVLPSIPPSKNNQYYGAQATAAVRAAAQHALDGYQTGDVDLPQASHAVDLSRSDTRSFGETHASELSSIGGSISLPLPYIDEKPAPVPAHNPIASSLPHSSTSPVINPQQLNQNPAPIPNPVHDTSSPTIAALGSDSANPAVKIPSGVTPTIAETGIPQSTGPDGPGPSSGTLRDVRSSTHPAANASGYGVGIGVASGSLGESAEDEKKRLEREERERVLHAGGTPQQFESAEDEKKRLERQERERILASGGDQGDRPAGEDLPPYKEF